MLVGPSPGERKIAARTKWYRHRLRTTGAAGRSSKPVSLPRRSPEFRRRYLAHQHGRICRPSPAFQPPPKASMRWILHRQFPLGSRIGPKPPIRAPLGKPTLLKQYSRSNTAPRTNAQTIRPTSMTGVVSLAEDLLI